jgi:transposase-like protein
VSEPKTLLEAVRHFSDLSVCHEYMLKLKWPDGKPTCPKCGTERVSELKTRRILKCNVSACQKQFSAKAGTIFEASPLGLDKWFVAVWSIANAKNGISSCELARALGVSQKTAWFMLHRIRVAMTARTFRKLSGEVESDETFVGGKAKNMHKVKREKVIRGRGAVGKTVVHGLLERSVNGTSRIRAAVVPSTEGEVLLPEVARNVEPGSAVYTDAHRAYTGLNPKFLHQWVDHAVEYVSGRVHTNGLENFWSLLKRTIRGTYVKAAPFHLFRYLDEQVFRFNERAVNDGTRFDLVMACVVGRRLTFRQLCGIGGCGFMGIE